MVRGVDIKYKNEFWHECCFHHFNSQNSNCINTGTILAQSLFFALSFVEIQIINTSHISKLTVKIQNYYKTDWQLRFKLLQNTHSHDM